MVFPTSRLSKQQQEAIWDRVIGVKSAGVDVGGSRFEDIQVQPIDKEPIGVINTSDHLQELAAPRTTQADRSLRN